MIVRLVWYVVILAVVVDISYASESQDDEEILHQQLGEVFKKIRKDKVLSVQEKCADVEELIKNGFGVNKPFFVRYGTWTGNQTPLMYICDSENIDMWEGGDGNDYDATALALAELLCAHGADVNGSEGCCLRFVLNHLNLYFCAHPKLRRDMKNLGEGCSLFAVLLRYGADAKRSWEGRPSIEQGAKYCLSLKALLQAAAVDEYGAWVVRQAELQRYFSQVLADLVDEYTLKKLPEWPCPMILEAAGGVNALRDIFKSGAFVGKKNVRIVPPNRSLVGRKSCCLQ